MNEVKLVSTKQVLGKELNIYGSIDEPLFLAKDVASWIEHSRASEMLKCVDEDEKLMQTILASGQRREMWFLTEDEDEKAVSPIYYIGQVRNMWFLTEDEGDKITH